LKQAILITAYKNFDHLEEIVKCFDLNFEIYIHIDRKNKVSPEILASLERFENVKLVSQKYKVNWGGFNHLKSILHLSKKALENPFNFYFHLISGHDYPIKNRFEFASFFKKHRNSEFIDCFSLPKPDWADSGGMDRIMYYNFQDVFDAKNIKYKTMMNRIVELQKMLKIKRSFPAGMPKLYGGSTWWSLSRECLQYVVNYTTKHRVVFNRFKSTFCSEEFYFPSVIMNSPFANSVEKTNKRFIDWTYRNGNNPAVLDESDTQVLLDSKDFFARKFESSISQAVVRKINREVHDRT